MNGSSRTLVAALATAVAMLVIVNAGRTFAIWPCRGGGGSGAEAQGERDWRGAPTAPMTIELFRWSTDGERAPLLAALAAPPARSAERCAGSARGVAPDVRDAAAAAPRRRRARSKG